MNGWLTALVVVLALAVSAVVGSPLTAGVLRLAARSDDASEDLEHETDDTDHAAPTTGDAATTTSADARDDGSRADPVTEPAASAAPTEQPLRGGTWIGGLERLAVTGLILVGYPAGIAFVIAVKGLGRYPELRGNPGISERFVIGTLASMLWAAGVGGAARAILLQ